MSRAQVSEQLVRLAGALYDRGWLPATSGNLSARVGDRVAITASGTHKGRLAPADILDADMHGATRSGRRPSAETGLHLGLYRRDATIGAVVHVHSPHATVLSRVEPGHEVVLTGWELQKAFVGVGSHTDRVRVPIVDNDQDIGALAATVERRLSEQEPVVGYLIRGHGLYAWGCDLDEAARHAEAFEFLFQCELMLGRHA